jgi:hypothetical protein
MGHQILRTMFVSFLVYLTNLICGTVIIALLGFSSVNGMSSNNPGLAAESSLWLFFFSLMLGFVWLLPISIVAFLAIMASKKVVADRAVKVFVLYSLYLLIAMMVYFVLPVTGKVLRESSVQILLMLSFEILLAYVCVVLLKSGKTGRATFTIFNVILALTLHELATPSLTFNYEPWRSCFLVCIYVIPGWYVLNALCKRWNLLNA